MIDSRDYNKVLWQKQRRGAIAEFAAAGGVAILPIGAMEQHGPHLPLDTDTVNALEISSRAALMADSPPVLVLPPISWGHSPYWMDFAGTITLRSETLIALFADIGTSVVHHGVKRMVILNAHGGNTGLVQLAASDAVTYGLQVTAVTYWNLIRDELREISERDQGSIGHAGELETSLQLYLQPELVDIGPDLDQVISDNTYADLSQPGPFAGQSYSPPDPDAHSPSGVYGYAPAGTAETGATIVERASERLAAFIRSTFASQSDS